MEAEFAQIPFQRNLSTTESVFQANYGWVSQVPQEYQEIDKYLGVNGPELYKQYSYASDVERAQLLDKVKNDFDVPTMSNQASISSMVNQNMEVEIQGTLKKLRRSQDSDSEYEEETQSFKKCLNPRNGIRRKKPNRDLTTIAKVIFTQIKKQLKERCPINLKPYFDVCPYEVNHRTLMDFEVPFLYVQLLDRVRPGSLQLFKNFLKEVKPSIISNAEISYASRNKDRFETFKTYLDRIYHAYFSNRDSEGRMTILYSGVSNPKVMLRLKHIERKLQQQLI